MTKSNNRFWGYALLFCLAVSLLFFIPSPAKSQCGNADGQPPNSPPDIDDLSAIINYLFLTGSIPDYANAEVDGYEDVTVSDLVFMANRFWCDSIGIFNRCSPLAPPLAPHTRTGDYTWIDKGMYPRNHGNPGTFTFNIWIMSVDTLLGFTLPFQVRIGDSLVPIVSMTKSAPVVGGTFQRYCAFDSLNGIVSGVTYDLADCYTPPGAYCLATVDVKGPSSNVDLPVSVEWAPYPTPVNPNTQHPVHQPIIVLKSYSSPVPLDPMSTVIAVTPTIQLPLGSCCHIRTGNLDCDGLETTDISDLTALIDYLYISLAIPCCLRAADCDGDGHVDISDLTALIDYLYISFTPLGECP